MIHPSLPEISKSPCPECKAPRERHSGHDPTEFLGYPISPDGGTGEIEINFGNVEFPGIIHELSELKRFNIVCKTAEESKTGHYVSYDDVLKLFHKYWGNN